MNFEFSEEQLLLRDQARGLLADVCSPAVVRRVLESDEMYAQDVWKTIAEMGWTATVIPEAHGGLGLSYYELAVIAEELGRAAAPVPFSSTVYLATEALLLAGSLTQQERWLPQLAAGEVIGALAYAEGKGQPSADRLETRFENGRLSGTKLAVADGCCAQLLVVAATSADGPVLCLVDPSV
ncbi:MAG: acyl-CoA dehydrogenase family protein, partial [Pseudomonadota bacterium]